MTLSRDAQVPPWIRPAPQFYREGIGAPGLAWAISSTGPLWSNPYGAPLLCPSGIAGGKIAFLYEPGFFVGNHDATEGDTALCGRIRSRWWVKVTEDTPTGWYDWDGTVKACQPTINEPFKVGDEIIVMNAGHVPSLTGEKRCVVGGGSLPVVPAMAVVNDGGDSADTWIVHDWVKIPAEDKGSEDGLTAAVVEARVTDVLQRIRLIAVDYCDEYEDAMAELGFREGDYRKGPPESRYTAEVKLMYEIDGNDLANFLEDRYGGTHTVNGTVRVASKISVSFDWDGEDEMERDDLIEAAINDTDYEGYDDVQIEEVFTP